MAVKIGTDNILRMVRPNSYKFTLDELNNGVNGFIEPVKMGPLWVMYSEEAKINGEPLNKVASFFFDVAIHGTVLVVPPHQLPSEWDLMEPEDYRYTADDIDGGFLRSIQQSLIYSRTFGLELDEDELKGTFYNPVEKWNYKPNERSEITEDVIEFYNKSYEFIVKNSIKDNVVLFEDGVEVTVSSEDMESFINQLIEHYVNEEAYEKCAKLKQVYEELTVN
jgi:hypothetical protein